MKDEIIDQGVFVPVEHFCNNSHSFGFYKGRREQCVCLY